jgi:cyclase
MSTSRREFIATSAVAAIFAALGRPSVTLGLQQQVPRPVFTPIRRNVGFFTMRGGTIGYLVNPGGVAVVDSQFPAEASTFVEGIRQRAEGRGVDVLINTHHHGDHTGGNISFRGVARSVVAHEKAAEHMRHPPGGEPPQDQLFPDLAFSDSWSADIGDEHIVARHYGRAHTSGDIVITFERANVVHMGDLMFNRRHPVVDRAAGATMRNWMTVLDRTVEDHAADTVYIFGHANSEQPVTGGRDDLMVLRNYFDALLTFVDNQVRAGHSREQILAMREPLRGFEEFGPFGQPSARDPLTCAYEEVTEGA